MMKPVLVDALHICMGGGLMILDYLIDNLVEEGVDFVLLKDIRCPRLSSEDNIGRLVTMSSDNKSRNKYYRSHRYDFGSVLCFGNIPPCIRLDVPVHTYLHNVSLLKIPADYGMARRLKSYLKKKYIQYYARNTDTWIVQTSNTACLVRDNLARKGQKIEIYPFFRIPKNMDRTPIQNRTDYVFIGDHTCAKGHEYLVEAWEKLSEKGLNRTLHLTVSEPPFARVIESAVSRGANICNHGKIGFKEVIELYNKSKATVYPSLNESLGLGIVEALKAGCDVIGCDLPYMKSVCEPSVLFQPCSPDSIVEAVLAYENGNARESKLSIRDMVKDFIKYLHDYE